MSTLFLSPTAIPAEVARRTFKFGKHAKDRMARFFERGGNENNFLKLSTKGEFLDLGGRLIDGTIVYITSVKI